MPDTTLNHFRPTASWENLRLRADLLRRLREFFDTRGFLEVETPILSADTVVDRHLDPFCVEVRGEGGRESVEAEGPPAPAPKSRNPQIPKSPNQMWLQTSPEFAMKRMLAAGVGRIYQVARVFRVDECGPLHNPEFTLLEWYQPGDGLDEGMQVTSDLCGALLGAASAPSERTSYRQAFERYVGIDPHRADGKQLAAVARKLGVEAPASLPTEDRDGWLDLLMVERVQPHLGQQRPTLLYDYPASQAALAKIRPDDPPVAERFELYIGGVEIANGYNELLDASELRARNACVNAQRRADGKAELPEESRLLAAMQSGLPASVGVALGFDRLVMAALGAKTIAEVVAFPFDRA
jgi:elongation factor P--(R)-beta-lysine ligase